ncbi:hypothetical protein N0V85_009279 [Neurospora sp. IMI 360204]|nr:hypothetical protein N0V85_009279 [Neurospora sp. IMI 360204]
MLAHDLAADHPVILGMPWLKLYNPSVSWPDGLVTFTEICAGRCLPVDLPITLRRAPKVWDHNHTRRREVINRVTAPPPTIEDDAKEPSQPEDKTMFCSREDKHTPVVIDGLDPKTTGRLSTAQRARRTMKQRLARLSEARQARSSIQSTADPAPKTKPAICRLVAG